jgi:autotransporter-associated beta strand protein
MGGAVFVVKGGSLTINGDGSTSGGSVSGGTGTNGGGAGSASGTGFFVQGSTLTFGGSGGYAVSDVIADQNGSGGSAASDGLGGTGGSSAITKNGTGTLTLSGPNTYSGGTNLNAGTIGIGSNTALGTGPLTFGGGTLRSTSTGSVTNSIAFGTGTTSTITAAAGQTLTFSGSSFDLSNLDVHVKFGSATDAGTVVLGPTLSIPVMSTTSSIEVAGGTLRFGKAFILGGSTTVDAGATLDASGLGFTPGIRNLLGGGTVQIAGTTLSLIGNNFPGFSGTIAGAGGELNIGPGSFIFLTGTNTYTGGTTIRSGAVLSLASGGSILAASRTPAS